MSDLNTCHLCGSADLYQGWCDMNTICCTDCGLAYAPVKIDSEWHPSKELVAFAWNNKGKHPDQCVDPTERFKELESQVEKLRFMIDNGLGWDDMKGGNIEDVM